MEQMKYLKVTRHTFSFVTQFRNRLTEINVNASVVNENIVHLKIRIFTRLRIVKLNKSILKRISIQSITNNFATKSMRKKKQEWVSSK